MAAAQLHRALDFVRDAVREAGALGWRFFDWLALVEWRQLYLTWFLALITGFFFAVSEPAIWFVLISFGIKVLAGGKRRAELLAREASAKANVANLERRLTEAQMATLQAQVEPHFLFNTLALIGQLIETDQREAARVHGYLIEYLRASLPQMRAGMGKSGGKGIGGTLGKQVELSRAYLAIMQARMKERLLVRFEVPDFLGSAPFPPMMLQTLIENAIKHGLEPKVSGGTILVRAQVVGATLHVDVCDDGVGIDLHAGEGVGLGNIRERLALLYGKAAELAIEIPPGGGACVSIRLPYRMTEDD